MSILVFVLSVASMVSFGYGFGYARYYGDWIHCDKLVIINPLMITVSALALIAVIVICLIRYKTSIAIFGIGFPAYALPAIYLVKNAAIDTGISTIVCFGISLISLLLWLIAINSEKTEEEPYNKEEQKYEIVRAKSKSELSGELSGFGAILFGEVNGNINTDEAYKIYYYADESKKKIEMIKLSAEETCIFLLEDNQEPYLLEKIETFRVIRDAYRKIKVSREVESSSYELHIPKNAMEENFEL